MRLRPVVSKLEKNIFFTHSYILGFSKFKLSEREWKKHKIRPLEKFPKTRIPGV